MNAKRVSFCDIDDVFTIPRVEGVKKPMTPRKKDLLVYSDEDLEEQIRRRKEYAIRGAMKKSMELDKQYKELQQYIMSLDEDDDDYCAKYEMYFTMMEENFFEQSILTRKLSALHMDK